MTRLSAATTISDSEPGGPPLPLRAHGLAQRKLRPAFFSGVSRSETVDGPDSGQLADAVQERSPLPQQDGHAAAQISHGAEFADDEAAVPENILAGDHAADRHRLSPAARSGKGRLRSSCQRADACPPASLESPRVDQGERR